MVYKLLLYILVVFSNLSCIQLEKSNIDNSSQDSFTITNDIIEVSVKTFGAELTSLKHNKNEYLWQRDSIFWKHQSPILFPIVGRLVDHEFIYQGKTYPMDFHGFAWKSNFKMIKKSSNSITFELTSTEKLKKIYPFDFILHVKYTIKGKALDVAYKVKNPSKTDDLYFSIGGHPAFNCPIENNQKRSDYELVFDTDAMPKSRDKESGLFIDKYTQYFSNPGVLKLQDSTFNRGALVFNPNPFSKVTLVHEPTQKEYLSFTFNNFPYLGIWSARKKDTPFICIEPWYGLADKSSHTKDYTKKEGVIRLEPNRDFNCKFTIEIL